MSDLGLAANLRISRELFLVALGAHLEAFESWVGDRIVALLEEDEGRAGEVLYAAGDLPEYFYFMREGKVRLQGRDHPPRELEGRNVFGLLDGLLEQPRSCSAIAESDLQLKRVRFDAWIELLDDSFALSRTLVLALARRVVALDEGLGGLGLPGDGFAGAPPVFPSSSAPRFSLVERLAFLVDVPLFRRGGVQAVSELAMAAREATFEAGALVVVPGAPPDRIHVVVEGEIDASFEGSGRVRTAGSGGIVGGATALCRSTSLWSARSRGRARTLSLGLEDWFDTMEEHFEMVRSALAALSIERERLMDRYGGGAEPLTQAARAGASADS